MSRRTYDTEIITLRQVNALNFNNSVIDPNRVLTTDGAGGTYWAIPSTLTPYGGLNELVVDNKEIISDLSYNRFYLSTAQGMGSIVDTNKKLITLYSKGFDTIKVHDGNTIYSSYNSLLSPTFTLVGGNGIHISSDPMTQSIYIQGQVPAISTGIYGYHEINVISNASTVSISSIQNTNRSFLTARSPSTTLSFAGVGDILLSTNVTQNIMFVGISSFTSKGYNDLIGSVSSLLTTYSTISTLSNAFTSSLVSTTSNLQYQITRTANNVENYYTNIDLFKLLSAAVLNLQTSGSGAAGAAGPGPPGLLPTTGIYSYASTLNVDQYAGDLQLVNADSDSKRIFSTVSFRLDSMSTLLTQNSQVTLTYSPSFRLAVPNPSYTQTFMTTTLICGTEVLPFTYFYRLLPIRRDNNVGDIPYNPYFIFNDTIHMTFKSEMINNISLTSSFTFLHSSSSDINRINGVNFFTAGNNTLSVMLTGTNYVP